MKMLKVIWYILTGRHIDEMCENCRRGWYCDSGHFDPPPKVIAVEAAVAEAVTVEAEVA